MKKGGKSSGIFDSPKFPSVLRLEGTHAKKTASQKVGETHTITIKAKKTGHTVNSDGSHSASYEPTSVNFEKDSDEGETGGKGNKEKQIASDSDQSE